MTQTLADTLVEVTDEAAAWSWPASHRDHRADAAAA